MFESLSLTLLFRSILANVTFSPDVKLSKHCSEKTKIKRSYSRSLTYQNPLLVISRHTIISNNWLPSKPKFLLSVTAETPRSTLWYFESTPSPKFVRQYHVSFCLFLFLPFIVISLIHRRFGRNRSIPHLQNLISWCKSITWYFLREMYSWYTYILGEIVIWAPCVIVAGLLVSRGC